MKEYQNQNNKPLNLDIEPSIQPEGTSRFRLNAVPETTSGEQGFVANEGGNINKFNLPGQGNNPNIPIGEIAILDDKTVIFSVRADNTNSEIGVYNEKLGIYSTLINVDCLNFKITHQVKGIFKIREGCNINIYFTDNINPWRTIDINNLNQYKDSLGNFDCNSFKLFRDYNQTNIDMRVFNSGGNTKVGVYQFTYQYLDDDFNPQPWNTPSNPIPIVKDSLNDYSTLDGNETNVTTNKSIEISINNLDIRFPYVRIGLIVSDLGTGFNSNAYILEEVPIKNNSITYLFGGIDPNKTQNTDLEAFQYLPPDYYTGKGLNQIDNSLILVAPKAKDINYVPFIQAALQIQSKYVIKDLFAEQTGETSFSNRYPNSSFYNKSLMRDEVYSFGIVYIFKDGTETPAFHIPGREANKFSSGAVIDSNQFENESLPNYNLHNRPKVTESYIVGNSGQWDKVKYLYNEVNIESNLINDNQLITDANGNQSVERWQLFNTAIRTEITYDSLKYAVVKGELAYWESQDYTYPEIIDCNKVSVYGNLTGQKVRYHKMPDATLETHFYGYSNLTNPTTQKFAVIRPLNLEFNNINIPIEYQDQIQGYRIVRAERNDFNSSVIDKGILYQNHIYVQDDPDTFWNAGERKATTQAFPFNLQLDSFADSSPNLSSFTDYDNQGGFITKSFHSPKSKIIKDLNPDFIKIERTLFSKSNGYTAYNIGEREGNNRVYYQESSDTYFKLGPDDVYHFEVGVRFNDSYIPRPQGVTFNYTNRQIKKYGYVRANEVNLMVGDVPFYNNCSNETFNIEVFRDINSSRVGKSFSPIGDLGFSEITDSETETNKYFNYDTQLNSFNATAYYATVKKYLPNQYSSIFQQVYSCPGNISSDNKYLYSDGDTFINDWTFKKYTEFNDANGGFLGDWVEKREYDGNYITARSLTRFWCESSINMELRNSRETVVNSYYGAIGNAEDMFHKTDWYAPKNYQDGGNMLDFLLPEVAWTKKRFGTVRNYYAYNKDFSIQNTVRAFFPLSINYDYCNLCKIKFPVRLANSNKAYQEERADNYRIFLPNNYRDIPSETGEISNIFIKDNKLFIQTTQSLWLQQVKPQQIKTDQATLYVGTGEFWEIPPNEVISTTNGYAGCQNRFGIINTPFGYFYPSVRERKVFLFNDKLTEISNQGLRNWFENNLEFEYLKQFPSTEQFSQGIIDNPSNPIGIGFTVAYDKRYRRIIFSKKDYITLNPNLKVDNNEWYLDDTLVYITDKTLFENKSWTLSYHPDSQGWFSWHSYLPFFMFNTQNNYYSFSNDAKQIAWIHNQNNYQQFYQDTYPFINELIFNKQTLLVNTFPTIKWYSLLTNNNQEVQDTFNKAIVYNDFQSSGELTLTNQVNPFQVATNPQESLIKRTERLWAFNSYRDYATNTPIFTSNWANTQNDYFIDKVPVNINPNKNVFELEKFRDNYLACRLIYDKPNNKFLSKFVIDTEKVSPR